VVGSYVPYCFGSKMRSVLCLSIRCGRQLCAFQVEVSGRQLVAFLVGVWWLAVQCFLLGGWW
jgi:hypothetical protein